MSTASIIWGTSGLLFLSGAACLVFRRQLLVMVLGLELMLNAANLGIVYYAMRWGDAGGLAVALLVVVVAAAEIVVGCALLIDLTRIHDVTETQDLRDLAG